MYIPLSKEGFLGQPRQTGGDGEHEGQDAERRVDRDEGGAEAGRAVLAAEQDEEAEEAHDELQVEQTIHSRHKPAMNSERSTRGTPAYGMGVGSAEARPNPPAGRTGPW